MATSSMIWVKVPNSYKGYATHKKWSDLPTKIGKTIGSPTIKPHKGLMPKIVLDANYIGIYCHFDGYPSGVGETLVKVFDTIDKVLTLVNCGHVSCIEQEQVAPYCLRTDIDEEWSVEKTDEFELSGSDYTYLFENDEWYECHHDYDSGKIVKTLVKDLI